MKSKFIGIIMLFVVGQSFSQNIETKDGVVLGNRLEFIEACVSGVKTKMISIKGMKIDAKKYCTCVSDNLIPTITSQELMDAQQEDAMAELFLNDDNFKIIMGCIDSNGVAFEDDFIIGNSEYSDQTKEFAIKACILEIFKEPGIKKNVSKESAKAYCECAIKKVFEAKTNIKSLNNLEDEDSEEFNEIIMPCIELLIDTNKENANQFSEYQKEEESKKDVSGDSESTTVKLTDYLGQGYKLKISINGSSRYYLFDTGASDMIISEKYEKELIKNGSIKLENYKENITYSLADNSEVEAKQVVVNKLKIGDFEVNNVLIAVMKNGSFLCGKSFLDKFTNWEIDKKTKTLTLYK